MPELPEVEVLVRHLRPRLLGRRIKSVDIRREKVISPSTLPTFARALRGAKFTSVERRGKYILFTMQSPAKGKFVVLGHLGMTGRMFVAPVDAPEPKHAAVVLQLGEEKFIYQDTRYFGRLTLDTQSLERLGPEPLGARFDAVELRDD